MVIINAIDVVVNIKLEAATKLANLKNNLKTRGLMQIARNIF
jgi:hypothetical protein